MRGMSGSGPLGAEAHIFWLGQPAQLSAEPACSDSGPGQCSVQIQTRSVSVSGCAVVYLWGGVEVCTWFWRNELWRIFERRVKIDLGWLF